MTRIQQLIAEELSDAERDALRLCGLGRGPVDGTETRILIGLRLVAQDGPSGSIQMTRLGKEVLGEVILANENASSSGVI